MFKRLVPAALLVLAVTAFSGCFHNRYGYMGWGACDPCGPAACGDPCDDCGPPGWPVGGRRHFAPLAGCSSCGECGDCGDCGGYGVGVGGCGPFGHCGPFSWLAGVFACRTYPDCGCGRARYWGDFWTPGCQPSCGDPCDTCGNHVGGPVYGDGGVYGGPAVGRPGCNNCGGGAPPAAAMPTPAPQSARKAAPRVTSAQGKRPAGAYGTNARYAGYSNPRYANGGSNNQRYAGQGSNGAMRPYYNPNVAPRIISQTDRAVGEDETPQVARSRQAVVRQ